MAGFTSNGSALANLDAFIDKRSGKPRRITAKVKKAVRLLNTGECTTLKAAAERAGLHPYHLSRAFKLPHVQLYIDESTRDTLATGKMLGAARLLELIHSKSDHVSFDASVDENGDEIPALKDLKQDIGNMLNKAVAAVEDQNDALAGVLKNNIVQSGQR
jgi:hypothetical protein